MMYLETSNSTVSNSTGMLCYYANTSGQMQIARIMQGSVRMFERVVFPGQRVLFNAPADAELEVQTRAIANLLFSERIPCVQLACG